MFLCGFFFNGGVTNLLQVDIFLQVCKRTISADVCYIRSKERFLVKNTKPEILLAPFYL